jgi:hypothetical protein
MLTYQGLFLQKYNMIGTKTPNRMGETTLLETHEGDGVNSTIGSPSPPENR